MQSYNNDNNNSNEQNSKGIVDSITQGSYERKRSHTDDDNHNEQDRRKQHATTTTSDSSSPSSRRHTISTGSRPIRTNELQSNRSFGSNNNSSRSRSNTIGGNITTTTTTTTTTNTANVASANAIELQQQQIQEQIRELLMRQSTLHASNSPTLSSQQVLQQQNDERMIIMAHQQQQQQRLMLSNYISETTDRNNDLRRLALSNRLVQSPDAIQLHTDQQQLQRLLLLQQRQDTGGGITNSYLQSLVARQLLSEQYDQEQRQQQRLHELVASRAVHRDHVAMNNNNNNNNDLLIQQLLLSQSYDSNATNTNEMNRYTTAPAAAAAAAATMNNHVAGLTNSSFATGNSHESIMLANRAMTSEAVISGFARAVTETVQPESNPGGNPRATAVAAVAHLLSPRNSDTSSNQQRVGQLKVGDDNDPNDHPSNSRGLQDLAMLRRQIQDRTGVSNLNREVSLEEMLTVRNPNKNAASLVDTAITISSSKIDQLQQLHYQQQIVTAQEAAHRSATLHSLLVSSNSPPNRNSFRTSDRAMIPNTNITSLPMDCASDEEHLSKYQVLIRRQLEYFVSQEDDVGYSVQGRKKQIIIGQVGIRCRHCSYMPHRLRGRGAGYYPSKLSGVYQAAQNMATNHLNQFCNSIPSTVRDELCSLRGGRNESIVGGGKQYWTNKCNDIGLMEYDDGVYFKGRVPTGLLSSKSK